MVSRVNCTWLVIALDFVPGNIYGRAHTCRVRTLYTNDMHMLFACIDIRHSRITVDSLAALYINSRFRFRSCWIVSLNVVDFFAMFGFYIILLFSLLPTQAVAELCHLGTLTVKNAFNTMRELSHKYFSCFQWKRTLVYTGTFVKRLL